MSNDYGPVLRKIAAAQAVLAFVAMEGRRSHEARHLRTREAAEDKLLDLWDPGGDPGDTDDDDDPMRSFEPLGE